MKNKEVSLPKLGAFKAQAVIDNEKENWDIEFERGEEMIENPYS